MFYVAVLYNAGPNGSALRSRPFGPDKILTANDPGITSVLILFFTVATVIASTGLTFIVSAVFFGNPILKSGPEKVDTGPKEIIGEPSNPIPVADHTPPKGTHNATNIILYGLEISTNQQTIYQLDSQRELLRPNELERPDNANRKEHTE